MDAITRKSPAAAGASHKLAIGWLTMFVIGSDLFVVSPVLPLIAADYAIPPASAGFSVTAFTVTYMLSAPLLGRLADRIGRGRVLGYCLCAFGAANLMTALAGNFTWFLAARSFAGAAAAGVSPSLYALIGWSAPKDRRATWLAVTASGLLLSLSLGAPIGLLAAVSVGWPTVFAVFGALSLMLAWANHRVWQDPLGAESPVLQFDRPTAAAIAPRLTATVVWSTAVYAMYTYLGEGLTSFGYSTEEIAKVIVFYGWGAFTGVFIGGRMADRVGAKPTSEIGLAGLCLCFLLLPLALRAGVLVCYAFGLSSLVAQLFFPAQQLRLANEFPTSRASILAWNNSALFLGISLGSLIGGQAISLGGFDADLVTSSAIAIAGCAVVVLGLPVVRAQPPRPSGSQGAR